MECIGADLSSMITKKCRKSLTGSPIEYPGNGCYFSLPVGKVVTTGSTVTASPMTEWGGKTAFGDWCSGSIRGMLMSWQCLRAIQQDRPHQVFRSSYGTQASIVF